MGRPSKSVATLENEGKSHRTKAELEARREGEKSVQSGKYLIERKEVRADKVAHKEFQRLRKLFEGMDKADELYSSVINRYCQIYSETYKLEQQRSEFFDLIAETQTAFDNAIKDLTPMEKCQLLIDFTANIDRLHNRSAKIDEQIMKKRKMMLEIEKENIMTVASGLRAVPKDPQPTENPLLAALADDDDD